MLVECDYKVLAVPATIAILHSHWTDLEEIKVKTAVKTTIFVLISSAMGFAQTPKQLGAWSVYPATGNLTSNHVVLLQSTSEEQYKDAHGNPVQAKLDVICTKGKLSAIALVPNVAIEKSAMSFNGPVTTTRIAFSANGQSNQSENWAVLDGGRSLSPYSEVLQGKLMRRWVQRISGTQKMIFQLDGKAAESQAQPSFATGELSEALASVGCGY
jgi:hypothetical protein